MSVRAGQMVHYIDGIRFLRGQNAGISNFNIPSTKVKEIGLDETLETTYETPELSWEGESWAMDTSLEETLTGSDPLNDGEFIVFDDAVPVDVACPFTLRRGNRIVDGGYLAPYLLPERVQYRFTNTGSSAQTFTLRGDSAFFVPNGTPRRQSFVKAGVGPYNFADTAKKTVLLGQDRYALNVTALRADGTYERLVRGTDFTDSSAGFTLTAAGNAGNANGTVLNVVYGTTAIDTIDDDAEQPGLLALPSEVKGKHCDLYIATADATPELVRIGGVQSAEMGWSVSYEDDRELGNIYAVERDYDEATSQGQMVVRPKSVDDFMDLLAQISGAAPNDIINSENPPPLAVHLRVRNPYDADEVLKTLVWDDARINIPAVQARVGQKTDVTLPMNSDSGVLKVYKGEAPF